MTEYAPGLPSKQHYGDIMTLPEDDIATLVRQRHQADKAGLHEDLRIGTPAGMLSWAVPKFLPEDDSKRLAIRQPLHTWAYNEFQGRLKHGYGKGTVSRMEKSPIVIQKRSPDHIVFSRGDSKDAPIYSLVNTHDNSWMLSRQRDEQPAAIRQYRKEHFKSVPVNEALKLIDSGAEVSAKIDGAGVLALLKKRGIDVYGIRSLKSGSKPVYTDYIGSLRSAGVPKELVNTVIRGELYGTAGGRVLPPNTLSGILNSTLMNAVTKRRAEGIKLMIAALALHEKGKDIYDPQRVAAVVSRLAHPAVHALPRYSGDAAKKLLTAIASGDYPLTSEGVVLHLPGKRPIKAKNTEDVDVYVKDVFKADTAADNRAGGFTYSLQPQGPAVGRVGTGFTHGMLRDMLRNPDKYKDRPARIAHRGQYTSGAYRAPSFIAMKED